MSEQWGTPEPPAGRDRQPTPESQQTPPDGAIDKRTGSGVARPEDIERAQAVRELKRRRDFFGTLGGWASVSGITTAIWFATGADGYFWPIWPMLGIGIGVVSQAATLWGPAKKEITEADIAAEMRRREERGR